MTDPGALPSDEAIWYERLRRASSHSPERDRRAPLLMDATPVAICHELVAILANMPTLGYGPGRRPNPWHRDPADPAAIEQGSREQLDKLGELFGIGSFPRSGADQDPTQERPR